jgi:arsenate reductase (thioredoxin)
MAEGFAKCFKKDSIEAYSAGIAPKAIDKRAIKVMAEAGIDISSHTSKHLNDLKDIQFDYVVTVCDHAHESCPVFPGKTVHVGFDDPPRLAHGAKTEEEALNYYRRVRDEIKKFVFDLPDNLTNPPRKFYENTNS